MAPGLHVSRVLTALWPGLLPYASKQAYLCLEAAGRELAPVLEHVGPAAFKPTSLAGLPELAAEDRAAVWAALAVGTKEVAAFERRHPAPQRPTFDKPSPAAKKKASKKAAAVAAEEEEEQAGEEMEEQGQPADAGGVSDDAAEAAASRPAKRARAAKPAAAAAAAADDDAQEEQGQEEQVREGACGEMQAPHPCAPALGRHRLPSPAPPFLSLSAPSAPAIPRCRPACRRWSCSARS